MLVKPMLHLTFYGKETMRERKVKDLKTYYQFFCPIYIFLVQLIGYWFNRTDTFAVRYQKRNAFVVEKLRLANVQSILTVKELLNREGQMIRST